LIASALAFHACDAMLLPMRLFRLFPLFLMTALAAFAAPTKPLRVAIIFDDGPIPGVTDQLVALLGREKVTATLGTVAQKAVEHPELTRAAAKAGIEIANHSYSHEHPKPLSDAKLEEQVVGAQRHFTETVGVKPVWYWPPFIELEPRIYTYAQKAGITVYPFRKLVASMDYMNTVSAEEIRRHATTGIEDGTVILFHEWRKESIEQLPAILADLRRQGCVFMTFSELAAALAADK